MTLPLGYTQIRAVNWSTLKHLRESPLHYRHALEAPPEPPTPSQALGQAVHLAVLEPHRYDDEVAVWDGGRRAGKVFEAWEQANAGKLHLREVEHAQAQEIAAAVRAHPEAAPLLRQGQAELVLRWTDEATGLACKGRVDWLTVYAGPDGKPARARLVDLKTTRTVDHRLFARQVVQLGYHAQLAHYQAGVAAATGLPLEAIEVCILAVENEAPHDVGVFDLDLGVPDGALHVGHELRRELLTQLAECMALDVWPGRYPARVSLALPTYALPEPDFIEGDGAAMTGDIP